MDKRLSTLFPKDIRKLLLLMAVVFALVLLFQHYEFPYGGYLSSLFSLGRPGNFAQTKPNVSSLVNSSSIVTNSSSSHANLISENSTHSSVIKTNNSDTVIETERRQGMNCDMGSVRIGNSNGNNASNGKANNIVSCRASGEAVQLNYSIPLRSTPSVGSSFVNSSMETLPPVGSPTNIVNFNTSSMEQNEQHMRKNNKTKFAARKCSPYLKIKASALKNMSKKQSSKVVSIPEMNNLLILSHASACPVKKQWPSRADQELLYAKSQIQNAPDTESKIKLYPPIYRNLSMFERSYKLMEKMLKVYIYDEGERPIFHQPTLDGIYASEGWFMKLMEDNKKFVTKNPEKAHLYYIPFSSRQLELTLYKRRSHNKKKLIEYMQNYVIMIAAKYNFWNRSSGTDHFLAACHDWAPAETRGRLLNSIRALCNADVGGGFSIGMDVSFPETNMHPSRRPLKSPGGNPPSQRPILAFFAGQMHGYVRPELLKHWENKDPDLKILRPMAYVKGNADYIGYMKSSKYCLCPKGHEVNSPRIVEAILYDCIPVIISDNYVPPFFEVLNWESFAVFILEKDIPNLKSILLSIPDKMYMEMHRTVKEVGRHFLWHAEPVKYDLFHMTLHSIWYNRLFQL